MKSVAGSVRGPLLPTLARELSASRREQNTTRDHAHSSRTAKYNDPAILHARSHVLFVRPVRRGAPVCLDHDYGGGKGGEFLSMGEGRVIESH